MGVEEGLASFVQRACREAAAELLDRHVGDPAIVHSALLNKAIGLIDNADRWAGLGRAEQQAVLGVSRRPHIRATTGNDSPCPRASPSTAAPMPPWPRPRHI